MAPRPEYMQRLGLLPPYSVEDVKRAYRNLAKAAHPDGGGSAESFAALHRDYERALSLAHFHQSRRHWLGERTERYSERTELMETIERSGGRCVLQEPHPYLADFGPDFAEILREVVAVHLTGPKADDDLLRAACAHPAFAEIRFLDASHSAITDAGLAALASSPIIGLDLRGTPVTGAGLNVIPTLERLEWLHIGGTRIGLWRRWRLRRRFPNLEIVASRQAEQPDFESIAYRQSKLIQRLATDAI
jgi:hypothetical protein